eukprot:6213050-Pleurochrysis_carterae.AAC.1
MKRRRMASECGEPIRIRENVHARRRLRRKPGGGGELGWWKERRGREETEEGGRAERHLAAEKALKDSSTC